MAEQMPLFMPESSWVPPTDFPNLSGAKVISWDWETRDKGLNSDRGPGWKYAGGGEVVGVGVAVEDREWYFPFAHREGPNLLKGSVLGWLEDTMSGTDAVKVAYNAQYELGWWRRLGLRPVRGEVYDPMCAAALLDENRMRYGLDYIARDYGLGRKDETLLKEAARNAGVDPKSGLWKLSPKYVGPYGEMDAKLNLLLYNHTKPLLNEEDMLPVMDLEMGLLDTWVDMTWRGVLIDQPWVEEVQERLAKEIKAAQKEIKKVSGRTIAVMNAAECAVAFEKIGETKIPTTPKSGQPSITKEWLEAHPSSLARAILRARRLDKVRGTFVEGMIVNHIDDSGRIHPDWNPYKNDRDAGVVSGRVSSSNPSAQVFPKRDKEFGAMTRGAFLPEPGTEWVSADQAQQEPRWFIHWAAASKCRGAQAIADAYNEDPDLDYHQQCADRAGLGRAETKDLNQGLAYGMGKAKAVRELAELGLDEERALTVYDRYHKALPYVKEFTELASRIARRRGWVKTILGRRFHFNRFEPEKNYKNDKNYAAPLLEAAAREKWKGRALVRAFCYISANRIVQGSSADQIKAAMLLLKDEKDILLGLQVHDELTFSNGRGKRGRNRIKKLMEEAISCRVPFRVEVTASERWMSKNG